MTFRADKSFQVALAELTKLGSYNSTSECLFDVVYRHYLKVDPTAAVKTLEVWKDHGEELQQKLQKALEGRL